MLPGQDHHCSFNFDRRHKKTLKSMVSSLIFLFFFSKQEQETHTGALIEQQGLHSSYIYLGCSTLLRKEHSDIQHINKRLKTSRKDI
jgi:hypothetical protein